MLPLIDINARIEFVSAKDISEPKIIFVMRPLTGPERLDLTTFCKIEMGVNKKPIATLQITGEYAKLILNRAIVEIKNGPANQSIAEIIDRLEPDRIMELMTKVGEINRLSDKEIKN